MDKDRKIQMEVKTAEVEKIIKSENIGFFRIMLTMASLLASSCFPTDVWIAVKKTNETFFVGSRFTWFIYRESFGLKIVFKLPG